MVFEVGRRVFTRLERFLKREGYLDPTEGDAPEALDRCKGHAPIAKKSVACPSSPPGAVIGRDSRCAGDRAARPRLELRAGA